MTETQRLRAEMEAMRFMFMAIFQSLPENYKEAVQTNLAKVRHYSLAVQSANMTTEQMDLMAEALIGMTWNPPDVRPQQ